MFLCVVRATQDAVAISHGRLRMTAEVFRRAGHVGRLGGVKKPLHPGGSNVIAFRSRGGTMGGNLVLTRREGEEIKLLDGNTVVTVKIASVRGSRVQLAVCAPPQVRIVRAEVEDRPTRRRA